MKVMFLVSLIGICWFSLQYKQILSTIPHNAIQPASSVNTLNTADTSFPEDSKVVVSKLTEEQKVQMKELGIDPEMMTVEIHSPAIAMLKKMNENAVQAKQAGSIIEQKFTYYKDVFTQYFVQYKDYAAAGLAAFLIMEFMFKLLGLWSLLRFFSDLFFGISRFVLIAASLAALIFAYQGQHNLWAYESAFMFWFPAGLLCLSAFGLKMYDMNFPVWKRLFGAVTIPLFSICGTIALIAFRA